jgi:hypothetical protein
MKTSHEHQEDIWFIAEGEAEERPLVFRGRQNVPADVVKSDSPTLLSIYWPYEPANDNGMPDEEINNAQVGFEDALEELDSPGVGFLMLVVTGNAQKEWHWYVSDVEVWMKNLNEMLADHPEYPIQIENSHEPDWALYHNFISGVDGI